MYPIAENEPILSIAELNRDVEPFIIQASGKRNRIFKDSYETLQFVHFSDIHYALEQWDRLVDYVNTYSDLFEFVLHTGDYCGCSHTEYYCDLYGKGKPCKRPILNCIGNHDSIESYANRTSTTKQVRTVCYPKTIDWEVVFMPGELTLNYHKDFLKSNIRLIVLDCYFGGEAQIEWLKQLLADAREKRMHVITAAHEITHPITEKQNVTFQTLDDFWSVTGNRRSHEFDHIIADFKKEGGVHICHLAGHEHSDYFGFTEHGVLNVVVSCASAGTCMTDWKGVRGTKTYDCFNVVAVDTNRNLLKLVRVGNNADHYLRRKRVLCWDYAEQKLIYND